MALMARAPLAVALPLFALEFDVMDLLAEMSERRYRGRVLIVGPPLPRRALVTRELKSQAPNLRLRLVLVRELAA